MQHGVGFHEGGGKGGWFQTGGGKKWIGPGGPGGPKNAQKIRLLFYNKMLSCALFWMQFKAYSKRQSLNIKSSSRQHDGHYMFS